MHQIDCHILTLPETNKKWLSQCLVSLESMPVNIYEMPGIQGHLGKARKRAIEKGSADYVTWVDHDDVILFDYFDEAVDILKSDTSVSAVYPQTLIFNSSDANDEFSVYPTKHTTPMFIASHGVVFRRSNIETIMNAAVSWPTYFDKVIKCHALLYGTPRLIQEIGYGYRRHDDQMSRICNYPEFKRLKKEVYANGNS